MTTRLPASFWSRAALSRVIGAHQRRQQTITAPWNLKPISLSTNSPRLLSFSTVKLGRQNPSNSRLFKQGLVDDRNAPPRDTDTLGWKKASRRKEEGDGAKSSGLKLRTRAVSSKALAQELRWLKDPRDFANRVALILQTGDFDFALKLVERGVRERMGCDVAWNHVLQRAFHEMTPKAVFKLYNDMKKAGSKPNAKTYTILLKGFVEASSADSRTIVQYADKIYKSIFNQNSGVKPNIIHTNAMLTVCERHNDMDMLWRIIEELPESGDRAPDMTTYTIILRAIRASAIADIKEINPNDTHQILARKARIVREAEYIWSDVIAQWKAGTLSVDNHTVGAMAELLLDGSSDNDLYKVLQLYHQTMGIPILQAKPPATVDSSRRRTDRFRFTEKFLHEPEEKAREEDIPFVDNEHGRALRKLDVAEEQSHVEEMDESLFEPIVPDSVSPLKPSNKDLTHILTACLNMTQGLGGGHSYWRYLTREDTPHRIEPDIVSCMQYLRLVRLARSSRIAAQVLREQMVPAGIANGKVFHVAFTTCLRDKKNVSVLLHANTMLELMAKAEALPDARVLENYVRLISILSEEAQLLLSVKGLDVDAGPTPDLQKLATQLQVKLRLVALAQLRPHFETLDVAMKEATKPIRPIPGQRLHSVPGKDAVLAMQRIRLLLDETIKLYSGLIPKPQLKELRDDSSSLARYSNEDVIKQFSKVDVHPTQEQKNAWLERRREL
ncbi:hypothetical protein N7510_009860 [Penicillium lagena]|uniref:uncharacterized protein n=1 Tax=Penicillium lagena TaxID=94218 RepID=UPI002542085E|nr:uncharacterized protein N7510_009860 [Penicillium lagena]KAJ5604706.1 hypothetical protein N7510_009860 [Penicillium lagena]